MRIGARIFLTFCQRFGAAAVGCLTRGAFLTGKTAATSKRLRHIVEMYAFTATVPFMSLLTSKLFGFNIVVYLFIHKRRASVKLSELDVRTPVGLFFGVWYAGVSIFGVFVR